MNSFTRRTLLRSLGALSLPAWFPRLAFAAQPEARAGRDALVCIFLRGGADALNVVVPFGDDAYHDARPTLRIAAPGGAGSALDLDGFFGLHPALAPLHELWQDGLLAPVHAVSLSGGSHSHFDAMAALERGNPQDRSLTTGWIGRHLAATAPAGAAEEPSPFRAVGIGALLPASLRGPVPATALRSIADFHLGGRRQASEQIARFQASLSRLYARDAPLDATGRQTFDAIATLAAADPGQYQPGNGAAYPESDLGMALLQVAQMVKAELGLEVACVDAGGWDTHDAQGGAEGEMAGLLGDLAASLQAFAADLADRLSGITVVVLSEFGRRLRENASRGTDHGDGGCVLLLGGGVAGGQVHGAWPGLAPGQLAGPGDLKPTTDVRTVLSEVVVRRLGNDALAEVFPGFAQTPFLGVCR